MRRAVFALRRARARRPGGAAILGYHRIAGPGGDPFRLDVAPAHFAEQLEVLIGRARPLPLGHLVAAVREGSAPPRAVALTFDDGYAECLYAARPLLERHGVPATVFVATGALGRPFWWDEVERIAGAVDPPAGPPVPGPGGRTHVVRAPAGPALALRLHALLLPLAPEARTEAIDRLRAWAGAPDGPGRHRALTPDEIVRLSEGGLIEIGAHTVTHAPLASLAAAAQRAEVEGSRADLAAILGRPPAGFSYPNGSVSRATAAIVREAGFAHACGSRFDVARRRGDPWRLPRLWVPDLDGDAFARWLDAWLPG